MRKRLEFYQLLMNPYQESLPHEPRSPTAKAGNVMEYDHNRSLPALPEQPCRPKPLHVVNPGNTLSGSSDGGGTTLTEGVYVNSGTPLTSSSSSYAAGSSQK